RSLARRLHLAPLRRDRGTRRCRRRLHRRTMAGRLARAHAGAAELRAQLPAALAEDVAASARSRLFRALRAVRRFAASCRTGGAACAWRGSPRAVWRGTQRPPISPMATGAEPQTISVPASIRFPVELDIPAGFDPGDPATWPRVEGRLEYVAGKLLYMPPCG